MAGIAADSAAACMARFMVASVELAGSFSCDAAIAVPAIASDNTLMQSNHAMPHLQRLFFIDVTLSFDSVGSVLMRG